MGNRRRLVDRHLGRRSLASLSLGRRNLASLSLNRRNPARADRHLRRGRLASGRLGLARGCLAEDIPTPYQHADGEHHSRQRSHGYGQIDQQQAIGQHPRGEQSHGRKHDREDGTEPDQRRAPRAVLNRTMCSPASARRMVLAESGLRIG
jgi:hypothetical protein